MGKEPLNVAGGTVPLRSGEGVGSRVQVKDIAWAGKRETWLSWRQKGGGGVQRSMPCIRQLAGGRGVRAPPWPRGLCCEVGGEVICEWRGSWGSTGDLRAVETVWTENNC